MANEKDILQIPFTTDLTGKDVLCNDEVGRPYRIEAETFFAAATAALNAAAKANEAAENVSDGVTPVFSDGADGSTDATTLQGKTPADFATSSQGLLAENAMPKSGGTFTGNITAPTFIGNLSGNATTATTATKLGSTTIGSTSRGIYLNAGVPTVLYGCTLEGQVLGQTTFTINRLGDVSSGENMVYLLEEVNSGADTLDFQHTLGITAL